MDVTLKILEARDDALTLSEDIDRYAAEATAEFRDDPPPAGTGVRLVREHFDAPECVFLTATEREHGRHIGTCVTAPFEDPLIGDRMPMVVVLSVHSSYRHRGLAGQMIRALRSVFAERGIHTLAARAAHNDDALISMGERWGFVRLYEVMVREGE
ncbi:MAG: GNAT family N-acetyltransferase [bacterium]|nr:GNAT family N-acetyltransferase [bacterium]